MNFYNKLLKMSSVISSTKHGNNTKVSGKRKRSDDVYSEELEQNRSAIK